MFGGHLFARSTDVLDGRTRRSYVHQVPESSNRKGIHIVILKSRKKHSRNTALKRRKRTMRKTGNEGKVVPRFFYCRCFQQRDMIPFKIFLQ